MAKIDRVVVRGINAVIILRDAFHRCRRPYRSSRLDVVLRRGGLFEHLQPVFGRRCRRGEGGSAFEAGPDDQLFDEAGICSADVTKDPNNCGNCGVACAADEVCSKSTCASACSASLTECSRSCVSLPSDHDHCGVCGNACLEAEGCARGKCRSCDAQPTELLNTATPCEFALPATFAADDVDFSNIIFLKSDMTRITIQQGALDGWAWDDSKAPKAVRLAGAACTAISTYGNPRLAISCRLYPD